jgi:hypothetical protein
MAHSALVLSCLCVCTAVCTLMHVRAALHGQPKSLQPSEPHCNTVAGHPGSQAGDAVNTTVQHKHAQRWLPPRSAAVMQSGSSTPFQTSNRCWHTSSKLMALDNVQSFQLAQYPCWPRRGPCMGRPWRWQPPCITHDLQGCTASQPDQTCPAATHALHTRRSCTWAQLLPRCQAPGAQGPPGPGMAVGKLTGREQTGPAAGGPPRGSPSPHTGSGHTSWRGPRRALTSVTAGAYCVGMLAGACLPQACPHLPHPLQVGNKQLHMALPGTGSLQRSRSVPPGVHMASGPHHTDTLAEHTPRLACTKMLGQWLLQQPPQGPPATMCASNAVQAPRQEPAVSSLPNRPAEDTLNPPAP